MPEQDAHGFPVVSLEQVRRDFEQTRAQVADLMRRTESRLQYEEVLQACERVESMRAALDWLADRLAIAEGGPLGRQLPRPGGDTPDV